MRWVVRIGVGLVVCLVLAAGTVYALSETRLGKSYQVPKWKGRAAPANADTLARGMHIAKTRGCLECHQKDGRGGLFIDAFPVMKLRPKNITPAGVTRGYTDADWERAIRHCVRPSGEPVPFMPCVDNARLSDGDLGLLITYLRSLEPVPAEHEPSELGPLGRVLFVAGELPYANAELIDHTLPPNEAPPAGPTAAYGHYLGEMCKGCHGDGLSGGPIPGVPPEWPAAANLTPHETGLGKFSEADFVKVLRTGKRPDGRVINSEHMPWKQFALFSDDEVKALWLHLQTVPAKAKGGR
jgi:mono/diheme cytochrome c family protein